MVQKAFPSVEENFSCEASPEKSTKRNTIYQFQQLTKTKKPEEGREKLRSISLFDPPPVMSNRYLYFL